MAQAVQVLRVLEWPEQQLMLPFQLAVVAEVDLMPQTLIAQVALVALLELPQV